VLHVRWAKGTVKWFGEKKEYGFISQEGGQVPGFKGLAGGDQVASQPFVSLCPFRP